MKTLANISTYKQLQEMKAQREVENLTYCMDILDQEKEEMTAQEKSNQFTIKRKTKNLKYNGSTASIFERIVKNDLQKNDTTKDIKTIKIGKAYRKLIVKTGVCCFGIFEHQELSTDQLHDKDFLESLFQFDYMVYNFNPLLNDFSNETLVIKKHDLINWIIDCYELGFTVMQCKPKNKRLSDDIMVSFAPFNSNKKVSLLKRMQKTFKHYEDFKNEVLG